MDSIGLNKKRFPLSLAAAPRGWHMLIARPNGEVSKLLKPAQRNEGEHPYLFTSQQDAWQYLKELFSFHLKQANANVEKDKLLNCTECGRVFRAKSAEVCSPCLKNSEFMFQQIWQGFHEATTDEKTLPDQIFTLLNLSEAEFVQFPEAFKIVVQQKIEEELELENRQPSTDQQLINIIKARSGLQRTRRAKKAF